MTMDPTAAHPSDELLAAFAGADVEATGDRALGEHVTACRRCGSVVRELQDLRLALAQLPDVAPPRPLRVLPPAVEPRAGFAERLAGFSRRAFAPLMAVGAGLVVVGAIGGTGAAVTGMASSPAGEMVRTTGDGAAPAAPEPDTLATPDGGSQLFGESPGARDAAASPREAAGRQDSDESEDAGTGRPEQLPLSTTPLADVPLWLVLLAGGTALVALAVTLRFVVAPRAG